MIEVSPIAIEEKLVLGHLLELYRYDFSEFDGRDLGENGRFGYPYLDHYWVEPSRHPFFARVNGRLAGFALVRVPPVEGGAEAHMTEFFVVRKYRGRGVGEEVARQVFARFPGRWVVEQAAGNIPAQRFWRTVIGRYTNGVFAERHDEVRKRVIQEFLIG